MPIKIYLPKNNVSYAFYLSIFEWSMSNFFLCRQKKFIILIFLVQNILKYFGQRYTLSKPYVSFQYFQEKVENKR